MGLPVRDQMKYWGLAAVVFFVLLWVLGDVLVPFLLGGAIAYFLDPVADRLERMGVSRVVATAIITLVAILLFVLMALLVVPTLINQSVQLFNTAPQLARNFGTFLTERFPSLLDAESTLRQSLDSLAVTVQERGGELVTTALSSAASLLNLVVLLVIVPVVSVYLLLDWDRMVARVDELLPRDHAPTIRKLAGQIDNTLASFIRGMGTVCLILGAYYAVALMLVGLQFGLVVGFVAGLVTFIPYLGALIGGALAIGLGLFQFWGDWVSLGLVAGIFVIGQVVEGNFLTPKLVGNSVGLHPVWLILALSVFGTLFGFVGMLVAVPVAAALGVVTRFAVTQYQQSLLYRGLSDHHLDENDEVVPDARTQSATVPDRHGLD
ncbi:AI-2E family transporter [Pseudosulfitobacter koreensis]|uniref:AI-2E family transporter n=1 Tax=Pseudosulfitobacter koreensis TaxID=2968472 RepID=A0ABT1Z204_9RHOB|nr:AI-2E family transporter [Pseudosulfitobacter koreense]MCR8827143.1 AI-2E family transporter [Pseudosulfitobacter koreense]